jgi:parallel beta-helix repeat protein
MIEPLESRVLYSTHRLFVAENVVYRGSGRALDLSGYDRVTIRHCTLIGTAGISIQAKPGSVIRIIDNQAFNIRRSRGIEYAQFVQVNGLDAKGEPRGVRVNLVVSGNRIINEPGKSAVEDVISVIGVRGSKLHPIRVERNTVIGAYPVSGEAYSGGGIIADRGASWVVIRGNTVRDTSNYGIAISGGSHNRIEDNTVTSQTALNVGVYVFNLYPPDQFKDNTLSGNHVKWLTRKGRNDYWVG